MTATKMALLEHSKSRLSGPTGCQMMTCKGVQYLHISTQIKTGTARATQKAEKRSIDGFPDGVWEFGLLVIIHVFCRSSFVG
jgi:hypothetical protein